MGSPDFGEILASYNAKREALAVTTKVVEKAPICRCGAEMVRHLTGRYFWCRHCQIREADLEWLRKEKCND